MSTVENNQHVMDTDSTLVTHTGLTDAQYEAVRIVAVADAIEFYSDWHAAFDVTNDAHVRGVFNAWFASHRWVRALGAFASVRERTAGMFEYGRFIEAETALLARAVAP